MFTVGGYDDDGIWSLPSVTAPGEAKVVVPDLEADRWRMNNEERVIQGS